MRLGFVSKLVLASILATGSKKAIADSDKNMSSKATESVCLSDRAELLLADGSISDTKIIRIASVDLYIPTSWLKPYISEKKIENNVTINNSTFNSAFVIPELTEDECPGIIHKLNLNRSGPEITLWTGSISRPLPNISPNGNVSMVRIVAALPAPTAEATSIHGRLNHLPKLDIVPGITVYLNVNAKTQTKDISSPSVEDLIQWLTRKPADRDNNCTFVLKAEVL